MPDIFINDNSSEEIKTKKEKAKPESQVSEDKVLFKHKKKYKYSPLASYMYCPMGADFINKDPEEEIILILRRHFITNLGWIFLGIIMLFAPMVLKVFPILDFLPDNFKLIAVMGWYMLTVAFIFQSFLSWFFNVNIITDERIIDVDFVNIVYRKISYAKIDKIQDVSARMGSVIRTMFNFGDVIIQTAAEIPQIEFSAIPRPDEVVKIVSSLILEEEIEVMEGRVR